MVFKLFKFCLMSSYIDIFKKFVIDLVIHRSLIKIYNLLYYMQIVNKNLKLIFSLINFNPNKRLTFSFINLKQKSIID